MAEYLHKLILLTIVFSHLISKPVIFFDNTQNYLCVFFHYNDLDFRERQNNCEAKVNIFIEFFGHSNNKIYEIKTTEKFMLNERNNIPDEHEVFLLKYKIPLPAGTYKTFLHYSNGKYNSLKKIIRIRKTKLGIKLNPKNIYSSFVVFNIPFYSYDDTLIFQTKTRKENIITVSVLFKEKDKYLELASYNWFVKRNKEFKMPLNIYSEGKYTILLLGENKNEILYKYDYYLLDTFKVSLLRSYEFPKQLNGFFGKFLHKKLQSISTNKILKALLKINKPTKKWQDLFIAFVDSLKLVKQKHSYSLYKTYKTNFYFIIENHENIRIP